LKLNGKAAAIVIRTILHLICKIDRKELKKIPQKGPFIVAMNHINFLEVPMIMVELFPRKIHGIAKKETWNNSILGWVANSWESLSIDREGSTTETFRQARKILDKGHFLIIAPEGTRSQDGKLRVGKPGVISIALRSKVPIIPIAHFGGEIIYSNLKKIKRTKFTFKVGNPIILQPEGKADQEKRKYFTDQVMYRIAELLPEEYRGVYSNLDNISKNEITEVMCD